MHDYVQFVFLYFSLPLNLIGMQLHLKKIKFQINVMINNGVSQLPLLFIFNSITIGICDVSLSIFFNIGIQISLYVFILILRVLKLTIM